MKQEERMYKLTLNVNFSEAVVAVVFLLVLQLDYLVIIPGIDVVAISNTHAHRHTTHTHIYMYCFLSSNQ